MPGRLKSREKKGTDFSISDAIKRKKDRLRQLEKYGQTENEHDAMNDIIDNPEDDYIKSIFED
jgi:hypothetical protein